MIYIDDNFFKLAFIGIITGMIASVVGGGAEILIVPLLIYLKVIDDYKVAIGTSLASLLLPIGIIAVYFYAKTQCDTQSCVKWTYALIISFCFVLGTSVSYWTSKIDSQYLKIIFAIITIILGIVILIDESHLLFNLTS